MSAPAFVPDFVPDDPHFVLETLTLPGGALARTKPGVRGHPDAADGVAALLRFAPRAARDAAAAGGPLVDASGGAGALLASLGGAGEGGVVLEASAAALRCARAAVPAARCVAGLPWDLGAPGAGGPRAGALLLAPPAERGSARVEAELSAAARALAPGGAAWIALHKDRGGKRYAKRAADLFGSVEVVDRSKGWRVLRAVDPDPAAAPTPTWSEVEVVLAGAPVRLRALPGVYAAAKLDPGSAELLARLPAAAVAGARVLDLGCGTGVLALAASAAGARAVTALDDDLAAVRSAARNGAERIGSDPGVEVRALHSDLDAALRPDERFDLVLCNPPFHVGRGVRLDLPRAFVRAAARRLRRSGELWLVANAQLPYEREFTDWQALEVVSAERFKVLRATR